MIIKNYVYSTVKEEDTHMSEFTPIQTQEDFDKAIKSRLAQKDRELAEQYKGFLSPEAVEELQNKLKAEYEGKLTKAAEDVKAAQDKLAAKDQTVSDLTKRAEAAESSLLKNKIAYDAKLPLELAGRLVGKDETELKADAEMLAGMFKPAKAAPLYTSETGAQNQVNHGAAMQGLLSQLENSFNS